MDQSPLVFGEQQALNFRKCVPNSFRSAPSSQLASLLENRRRLEISLESMKCASSAVFTDIYQHPLPLSKSPDGVWPPFSFCLRICKSPKTKPIAFCKISMVWLGRRKRGYTRLHERRRQKVYSRALSHGRGLRYLTQQTTEYILIPHASPFLNSVGLLC